MPEYRRIISPEEARIIEETGSIRTNFSECDPYPAGMVVFLLLANASLDYIRTLVANTRQRHAQALIVMFSGDIEVERDRSGWPSAVVHRRPLKIDGLTDFKIEEVPDSWS